jgi:hypothetical protein
VCRCSRRKPSTPQQTKMIRKRTMIDLRIQLTKVARVVNPLSSTTQAA